MFIFKGLVIMFVYFNSDNMFILQECWEVGSDQIKVNLDYIDD